MHDIHNLVTQYKDVRFKWILLVVQNINILFKCEQNKQ